MCNRLLNEYSAFLLRAGREENGKENCPQAICLQAKQLQAFAVLTAAAVNGRGSGVGEGGGSMGQWEQMCGQSPLAHRARSPPRREQGCGVPASGVRHGHLQMS